MHHNSNKADTPCDPSSHKKSRNNNYQRRVTGKEKGTTNAITILRITTTAKTTS